ncbi:hypothetical protein QYF36_023431 [Acer negundo]|nr:hypothetical protein QYF36_023431 [Acer negundo]
MKSKSSKQGLLRKGKGAVGREVEVTEGVTIYGLDEVCEGTALEKPTKGSFNDLAICPITITDCRNKKAYLMTALGSCYGASSNKLSRSTKETKGSSQKRLFEVYINDGSVLEGGDFDSPHIIFRHSQDMSMEDFNSLGLRKSFGSVGRHEMQTRKSKIGKGGSSEEVLRSKSPQMVTKKIWYLEEEIAKVLEHGWC